MKHALDPHAMTATPRHDERERQAFVGALRGHLASRVMPGNYQVYAQRVGPAFERQHVADDLLHRGPAGRVARRTAICWSLRQ